MTEIFAIKFTYKSPCEDVDACCGFNSDGSINVKYTLATLREMLLQNVSIIDKLLEKSENITTINPIGYGVVQATVNSDPVLRTLLDDNVLHNAPENADNENEYNNYLNEFHFSDDEETNQDRLNMVNNMTNQNDSQTIFNKDSDSDSDSGSESDIIDDENNTKSILDKYNNILNANRSDDSSDSDGTESE